MKLAVIGDPVDHSRSPAIFAELFLHYGVSGTYEAIRVQRGESAAAISDLMASGYSGLNVTTPLKEEAFAAADSGDAAAEFVQAANVLSLLGDRVTCANTDGIGARIAIEELIGGPVRGRTILLLGTGPTGRAAALELARSEANLTIWNRTHKAAMEIAKRLNVGTWEGEATPEIAFSTLPPGVELEPAIRTALLEATYVIDANYGPRSLLGRSLGRAVVDGYRMLYAQAVAGFEIFRDQGESSFGAK